MNAGRTMNMTSIVGTATACCLMLAANPQARSQAEQQVTDEVNQSEKAARVLHELMAAPDEGIPQNLGGGSFGLQIGAESTDFVMLFMTPSGMASLLTNEFTLGGDASVAAGPVGRQAGASTDLELNAQILSYSRSKGLFAGLELKGVVIKPDEDDMRAVYGADVTAKDVLKDNKVTAPSSVRAFQEMLTRHSPRNAEK